MKKLALLTMAAAVAMIAGLLTTPSYGLQSRAPKNTAKTPAAKPDIYVVVLIGDELPVVKKKSELATLRKTIADEDKRAKKDYDDAKKDAVKNKDKSDLGKPPAKRKVTVLKDSLKSEQDANDWIDKHPAGSKDAGTKTAKKSSAW
jgi:hypothetical protein